MRKLMTFAAALAVASAAQAATTFTAGDLAIIGYNSSNPDTVAMIAFKDFDAGTSLILTDYGWSSTNNTFRFGGEGYIKATALRAFVAGEVFVIQREVDGADPVITPTADWIFEYDGAGNVLNTGAPQFAPSAAGDGVIIFQGEIDDAAPSWSGTLLYALNVDGTNNPLNGWQANATNSNTSALPDGLVDGLTAIGLVRWDGPAEWQTEWNDYQYIGPRTGTQAELLAAIGDRTNWEGRDAVYSFDTTPFTIAVPEPGTASLALLAGGLLLARRRARA